MAITLGPNLNAVASPQKLALAQNYIDFTADATGGWAQQYLPDLLEKEAEVFGSRTISGFLAQIGAEEAMSSDQVVWSEQGRLHLSYQGKLADVSASQFEVLTDIDGNVANDGFTLANHGVRVGDMVLVSTAAHTAVCQVTVVSGVTITALPYTGAGDHMDEVGFGTVDDVAATILVFGSEFGKGTSNQTTSNSPVFKSYSNKPIIMKDMYEVNGSDMSQIGWVEVTGEEGQNGYMWYLKAEGDTRARFADYLEMSMLESVKVGANTGVGSSTTGTEGLFAAIEDRGHITTVVSGVNAATDLAEFDAILAKFDQQGAIEENMLFVNRATSLAFDDMLASMNSYGAGGTSYGVFSNSEDMALNLGFSGFRRGSYDFYKSDMRYLNDKATRGAINTRDAVNAIRGVIVPAGTSTVYDGTLGKNLKRPFLHVRYRASQAESRKMKTWITGSVGGNITSDLDAMTVNYLSERCLVVQGANNFMLMK